MQVQLRGAGLQQALNHLIPALFPDRILLFGSQANGTAHSGSDIDLLIVLDFEGDPFELLRRARQLVARIFPRIDLVICTLEEFRLGQSERILFLESILAAGVTVYERP